MKYQDKVRSVVSSMKGNCKLSCATDTYVPARRMLKDSPGPQYFFEPAKPRSNGNSRVRPQEEDLIFCPVCALYVPLTAICHQNCVMLRAGGVRLLAFFLLAADWIKFAMVYLPSGLYVKNVSQKHAIRPRLTNKNGE